MKIKHLNLTNIRAFSRAEFSFEPGVNLIVGINGAGKSTVLDSLCVLLSQAMAAWYGCGITVRFSGMDFKIDSKFSQAEVIFNLGGNDVSYTMRGPYGKNKNILKNETEVTLNHEIDRQINIIQPCIIYYSPRQDLSSTKKSIKIAKDSPAICFDIVDRRELRLMEFADWWLAQTTLVTEEAPNAQRHLDALNTAVTSFIDACSDVRVNRDTYVHQAKNGKQTEKSTTNLSIDKAGVTLDPQQLSDGERGMLALALDLTRRLSQANPDLANPLEGEAIVLIDELDLHLHPQWQRTIVKKLTTTFPNCQFIATTHSPLIIGEVAPENIILLEQGQPPIRPSQSLGMDTDWILKYLMGATTRNTETETELKDIATLIETEDYDEAIDRIDNLRDKIGEFPELVRLQTRIDRFQLLGE
jgi:predicted ATP-binding protein involved in virulence